MKSFAEINQKIKEGKAVVLTAEEMIEYVKEKGVKEATKKVDVVTSATFGPMCSSGLFLNFGQPDIPIKMKRIWLNDVLCYGGLAAADGYLGATELSQTRGMEYGGAQVIEDLLQNKKVHFYAEGAPTDCYPKEEIETEITLSSINQAILFNPRNAYQNYNVATNSSSKILYTYMGTLLPRFGNASYSSAGELSPLLKDPFLRTIGIGTRIFLGGAQGYIAWEGTQHNPKVERDPQTGIPYSNAATVAVIGDLKQMSRDFLRAGIFYKYGVTLFVGIGVAIPILDEDIAFHTSIGNEKIFTTIVDYGKARREKPVLGKVNYQQLRSGKIEIKGKQVPTFPLSSLYKAREITKILKNWIEEKKFYLQEPIQKLPLDREFKSLEE